MNSTWTRALLAVVSALPVPLAVAQDAGPEPAQPTATAPAATAPASLPADLDVHYGPPPVRAWQTERMIRDAVEYLYSQRNKAGHWEEKADGTVTGDPRFFGGTTALATYALLASGESPQNPRLKPAIDWLRKLKTDGTYVVANRINAYAYLPATEIQADARADWQFLVKALGEPLYANKQPNPAAGLYDYTDKPSQGRVDHSTSQYAVLGMWAAEQLGIPAPDGYWKRVEEAWLRDQLKSGGWNYNNSGNDSLATGAMTAAGVATLYITQDYLRLQNGTGCNGAVPHPQLDRGLDWLAQNFNAGSNPNNFEHHIYWLYAVERCGIASGRKFFGSHNWYEEGTRALASRKNDDGSFSSDASLRHSTSFALLFLARGRVPVLFNKLEYAGPWSQRPRDAANLARWYAKNYETELHWQVVGADNSPVELHDAPILMINGSDALAFSDEQKLRLRRYVEDGGLIVANADCQSAAFTNSFKQLMIELFPAYPMRELPPDHVALSGGLKKPVQVIGQSNGVRELCLLIPTADPSRAWQLRDPKRFPDAFDLAASIVFYATDKGRLKNKGEGYLVMRDAAVTPTRTVQLARLRYAGNWDPEPGGWRRLRNIVHNENRLDLRVSQVTLGDGKLADFKIAHLTGTDAITLTDEQLTELKSFIVRGGTLIVDAAGGNAAFADAVKRQLSGMIAGAAFAPLAPEDKLLADTRPLPERSADIFQRPANSTRPAVVPPAPPSTLTIDFRRFARTRGAVSGNALRLEGLKLGRRWAVVFSPVDLSTGLVGQSVDGVVGYTPTSATEIVRRIVVNLSPPPPAEK